MHMKLKSSILACTALLLAFSINATFAVQDGTPTDVALDALLVEYTDTLRERHRQVRGAYQNGLLQYSQMLHAQNELWAAELRVVTDPADRIAAMQKRFDNYSMLEERMAAQLKVGDASSTDMLKAKSERLLAQIELARAQR